jgi:RecA-family ATPase
MTTNPPSIDRSDLQAALDQARRLQIGLSIVNGAELYERQFEPRKFVVDGLIKRGDCVLLAGRPKSGKSWLLLQLAQAIDTGKPFLGRATTKCSVLYLALEDGAQRIHERQHIRKWKPEAACFAFGMLPLSDDGLDQLRNAAHAFDVVVIDTLRAACGAGVDENDNAEMGAIVQSLADYAHTECKTILISHHTRKGDAEDAFDLIRGAGAIRGAYDVGVVIQRKPKEAEAILRVESRDVEADDMTIKFEGVTGWSYEGDGAKIDDIRAGKRVVTALQELGDDQTKKEIAQHLGISESGAHQQLLGAEREGLVIRRKDSTAKGRKAADLWSLKP